MREGHCCEGETLWQGRVSVIVEGLCGEGVTVCYKGWVVLCSRVFVVEEGLCCGGGTVLRSAEEGLCCGGGSLLWRRVCAVEKGLCY